MFLIGNSLLHSLKGIARSDEHNWVLGVGIVFLAPVTFAAMLVLPPPEAKESRHIMYVPWLLAEAALSMFNVSFFVKRQFFEKEVILS
jgi:hypothetical protein